MSHVSERRPLLSLVDDKDEMTPTETLSASSPLSVRSQKRAHIVMMTGAHAGMRQYR
jgi:hypothetical protein